MATLPDENEDGTDRAMITNIYALSQELSPREVALAVRGAAEAAEECGGSAGDLVYGLFTALSAIFTHHQRKAKGN